MAKDEESPPLVVCDAGPLIHLDELGCLGLLGDFPQVLVPETVWLEVSRHRPAALQASAVHFIRESRSPSLNVELEALSRLLTLHPGEKEALQVAMAHPGCLLLTDDTAARLAAGNLGLPVHGTVGILVRFIRRGQKTRQEVLTILRSLAETSTLHLRASLLQEIVRQVEESP